MFGNLGLEGTVVEIGFASFGLFTTVLEAENSGELVFEARDLVLEGPGAFSDRVVMRAVASLAVVDAEDGRSV